MDIKIQHEHDNWTYSKGMAIDMDMTTLPFQFIWTWTWTRTWTWARILSFMQGQSRMIFHIYISKKYFSWWQWSVQNTLDSISQTFDLLKFDFFCQIEISPVFINFQLNFAKYETWNVAKISRNTSTRYFAGRPKWAVLDSRACHVPPVGPVFHLAFPRVHLSKSPIL